MLDEGLEKLRGCIEDPVSAAGRVAATVMLASAELEAGRPEDARVQLEVALGADQHSPVDHAWLCLQHARALIEVGDLPGARAQAQHAYAIRDIARHDVTATAISGVAAAVLFNTANFEERSLKAVVQDSDTAVAWWRAQTALRGASAAFEREFKNWSRDTSVTIGGQDQANDQLYAAGLSASHLGAHGAWAHLTSLLGRDVLLRLDRFAPHERVAGGIADLRLGGDEKALKQAGRRLLEDGPAVALQQAASLVRMDRSTTSTAFADLALLNVAGDVLDEDTARAASEWLAAALREPPDLLATSRTGRAFAFEPVLVEHLTSIVARLPDQAVRLALEFVPPIPDVDDPLLHHAWARFLERIPGEAWTDESAAALEPTNRSTTGGLKSAIAAIRARFDDDVRVGVLEELRHGSLLALQALGDVTKIPAEFSEGVVSRLIARLGDQRTKAADRATSFGGSDLAHALAVILSFHPNDDAFASLLEYLHDPNVARSLKRGALRTLVANSEHLSAGWKSATAAAIAGIDAASGAVESPFEDHDISAEVALLTILLGELDTDDAAAYMARLLGGNEQQRMWACRLAAAELHEDLKATLAILSSDQAPAVRASAVAALVTLTETGRGNALLSYTLEQATKDPGVLVPSALAAEASRWPSLSPTVRELLDELADHCSATVRRRVMQAQ